MSSSTKSLMVSMLISPFLFLTKIVVFSIKASKKRRKKKGWETKSRLLNYHYNCFLIARVFENEGISTQKNGQFLAIYKALTLKTLRKTKQITTYNHAEKPHNLRQISPQTASNDHVFWVKWHGHSSQIATHDEWNCTPRSLKLQNNSPFSRLFFSIWCGQEVLKSRG